MYGNRIYDKAVAIASRAASKIKSFGKSKTEIPSIARAEILMIIISIGINTGKPRIAIMDDWLPLRAVIAEIMVRVMAKPVMPLIMETRYEEKFHCGAPFRMEKISREMNDKTSIKIIP